MFSTAGSGLSTAQGTKQWTTTRFEEFERGTPTNVAIRNDGRLEPAPALKVLVSTSSTYLWSVADEGGGSVVVGTGAATGGSQVLRVGADGKPTPIAEFKELNVQALTKAPDGSLLAATSPDGKVYRIAKGGKPEVIFDPATTAERPKYLWALAMEPGGGLLVAAGAPAAIYRISLKSAGGKPEVVFKSGDQHIRCLLAANDGTIYAGSDGAGIVYRIGRDGKPFALYTAPKHEITSLALDPAGNLYLSAVGDRRPPSLPPLPAQGEPRISITFQQPGSSLSASSNALIPDGSEIDRIAPDGTPLRLLTLRDDVVYALLFRNGALLAAAGNKGRVYRVDVSQPGVYTDVAHTETSQATAFAAGVDGVAIATANSGKVFWMSDASATDASYTSEVFDGEIPTLWGRAETMGSPGVEIFARAGNVENVRGVLGDLWSEWKPVAPNQTPLPVPLARYVQWKAVLHPGAVLDSLTVNYLQRNLPPVVEDIAVQPGARVPTTPPTPQNPMVAVSFRATAAPTNSGGNEQVPGPLMAQRDRGAVTVRWAARDPNGDDLMFALYFREVHAKEWRLLKDKISERVYSFDAAQMPDGEYEMKVVASDAPVHTDADTLTGERVSASFVVDTTPPVPGVLSATVKGGVLSATFEATDATSPIGHAEFSVDAGPWQYLEPVGKLSDSKMERYAWSVPVTGSGEHTVAVRVVDRADNAVSAKAVAK